MCIRMKSKDGGFTHAYTESEKEYLINLGWTVEEKPVEPVKEEPVIVRRGRKPRAE